MALDADLLAETILDILDRPLRQMAQRLDDLEKRFEAMPIPRDGESPDPKIVAALARDDLRKDIESVRAAISALPELPDIPAMVEKAVSNAVASLPPPGKGEPGKDADPETIAQMVLKAITAPPTIEEVAAMVNDRVAECVAAIPRPADGRDGAPGRDGKDGAKGEKGADGRDGIGLAGAMIDREGELAITLTNGEMQKLVPVVGRDGAAGRDGTDGVGFDDMALVYDGERTVTLRFVKDERVREERLVFPVVLDRGVYASGKEYSPGDAVTYGGGLWIAQEPTDEKPDGGKGWRLAVKRGRDGRDGEMKPAPEAKPVKVR
jgi:hypothetical protein